MQTQPETTDEPDCPTCGGRGFMDGSGETCKACGGVGVVCREPASRDTQAGLSVTGETQRQSTPEHPPPHINTHERATTLDALLTLGRKQNDAAQAWMRLGCGAEEAYRRAQMGMLPDAD
jgi:hypothetical protein